MARDRKLLKKGHEVEVSVIPNCDICASLKKSTAATHDGATRLGPWAYMCDAHWKTYGPGTTGIGMGQKLILREVKHDGS
jgi:hypothetical protein